MLRIRLLLLILVSLIYISGCGESTDESKLAACKDSAIYYDDCGSGTESDPYLICNADQLVHLSTQCSSSATSSCRRYYKLESDIDMSGVEFHPIGGSYSSGGNYPSERIFDGVFDGNNKTIRNLTISEGTLNNYIGLFSYSVGIIKKLKLDNANISGGRIVGAVSGYLNGGVGHDKMFEKIVSTNASVSGTEYVGGLVGIGLAPNTISELYSSGNVIGTDEVGGLLGSLGSSTFENNSSSSKVKGDNNVGGLIGRLGTSDPTIIIKINTSFSTGNVTVLGTDGGGLIGDVTNSTGSNGMISISNSFATGSVDCSGADCSGLLGSVNGSSTLLSNNFRHFDHASDTSDSDPNHEDGEYNVNLNSFFHLNIGLLEHFDSNVWTISSGTFPILKSSQED